MVGIRPVSRVVFPCGFFTPKSADSKQATAWAFPEEWLDYFDESYYLLAHFKNRWTPLVQSHGVYREGKHLTVPPVVG